MAVTSARHMAEVRKRYAALARPTIPAPREHGTAGVRQAVTVLPASKRIRLDAGGGWPNLTLPTIELTDRCPNGDGCHACELAMNTIGIDPVSTGAYDMFFSLARHVGWVVDLRKPGSYNWDEAVS